MKWQRRTNRPGGQSAIVVAVIATLIILALHFGRDLFIPFALALLLTFLLTPLTTRLERLHLGRPLSAVIVLIAVFSLIGTVSWLGTVQLADIAERIPQYRQNIQKKLQWIRTPGETGLAKAIQNLQQIGSEVTNEGGPTVPRAARAQGQLNTQRLNGIAMQQGPIPVAVVQKSPGLVEMLGAMSTPATRILAQVGAVAIFTLFMLIQRRDLRDRLLQLLGIEQLNRATSALDDAGKRISRYILAQCFTNGIFGLLLGSGMYFIGVPNAGFWGAAGAVLRFVPYLGTLIAGAGPLLLAVAVFDGWTKPLLAFALFASIETMLSGFLEPWFYGAHTGLSSLAILASASFWTLLWGPIGLVLSMPLTVCLLVLGRYSPSLRFLTVILGDEPVLEPNASYYQRLLAQDEFEARSVVKEFQQDKSLVELYDSVMIPGLALAEQDRHQKALDEEQIEFIRDTTRSLIEEAESPSLARSIAGGEQISVLCVAARDEADELVGLMLAQVLQQSGMLAKAQPLAKADDMVLFVEQQQPDVVVVSALPPYALNQARKVCRRIRERCPKIKVVLGYWDMTFEGENILERVGGCFEDVVTSLQSAHTRVELMVGVHGGKSESRSRSVAAPLETITAP